MVWIWRFHYISIPFMALSGFALIIALLLVARVTSPDRGEDADEGATLDEHLGATDAP